MQQRRFPLRSGRVAALAVAAVLLAAGAAAALASPARRGRATSPPRAATRPTAPDFTREVRPVLARHCFKCHGPDEKTRMAGLRLDTRAGALQALRTGRRAVLPGRPEASELVRRIHLSGAGVMPPPATKNPLTAAEKEILRRWVASGAEYRQHWAFLPPRQAPLPAVRRKEWPRNPVDYFILARLEAAGLQPSPEADRYTLARRVAFDLTGLPPTPEEAEAFVHDPAPGAYERYVDRLLASPHYGERWARRWLDLARYADTNGYEKDRPRSIWPYRDWVIRAFNADMPFNRFTIAQLAGDMLPNATLEDRIATGFHRNTMLNEEGGIDPLEFRFHAMTDRVATTGTVWLGMTIACAQCHTHKFDPISQREYYQFMALLNNAEEPEIAVPDPAVAALRAEIEGRAAALERALPERFPAAEGLTPRAHLEQRLAAWLRETEARSVDWRPLVPAAARANLPLLSIQEDGSVLASGDQSKRDTYELTYAAPPGGWRGVTALRLEALTDPRLPRGGPGRVFYEGAPGDAFLSEVTVTADGRAVKLARATASFHAGNNTAERTIDGEPQSGWSLNGGQGRTHTLVFNLAEPLGEVRELKIGLLFEFYYACGLGRVRFSATTAPAPPSAGLPPAVEEAALVPEGQRSAAQREVLFRHFLEVAPELAPAREEIARLRATMPALPTTLVFQERPAENPRPTPLYHRGEFLQPRDVVQPGTPAVFPPLPPGAPRNRLTLARWLVDPANPLVGRVTMNREWSAFFGQGLVRTTEDFGYQGEAPSHPELLDWLAVELVKQGWSLKKMHRLLVTSATYRQSSRATPALLAKDPGNRLLGRGPRQRLDAEMVRDAALRASGLLSAKMYGPSVFPPQPPGVTSEGTYGPLQWKVSEGEDRYRRGLYTFTKRTAPYAMFATFDAPSGEACTARRETTNTPLQALTLLNDGVVLEAAQALGAKAAAHPGETAARAAYLFRRCLTRPPRPEEMTHLVAFYGAQRERLARGELDAAVLAGPGEGDARERAAWALTARVLLNLDEAVSRR